MKTSIMLFAVVAATVAAGLGGLPWLPVLCVGAFVQGLLVYCLTREAFCFFMAANPVVVAFLADWVSAPIWLSLFIAAGSIMTSTMIGVLISQEER